MLLLGSMFYLALSRPLESDLVLPVEVINIPVKQKESMRPIVGLPTRLRIPEINVDSLVEFVGVTPFGTMGIPDGPVNVAWFEHGSRPGEVGNAVIAGHYGWKNNIQAVFDNLHNLQIGDRIYTEDAEGATVTFVVREIRLYDQSEDSSDVFISNDGKAHLNLITCEGPWNRNLKTRPSRLVVFADKE